MICPFIHTEKPNWTAWPTAAIIETRRERQATTSHGISRPGLFCNKWVQSTTITRTRMHSILLDDVAS